MHATIALVLSYLAVFLPALGLLSAGLAGVAGNGSE
jgi:hypothetical protein